ncbi:MAG: thioredoxin domain-containing protein [Bacteroidota bacterium]
METTHKYTNALIHASSPYLLQHAHNPVNWLEWNDETLALAQKQDKMLLVSIGYSACHWCHVMEHESFENEEVAAIMNEHFICIKVDREERPDIDQIYMDAVQLLTGQGGWPLNCFALPNGQPLHGGTYFPMERWKQTLLSIADFYKTKKDEAYGFADDLTNGIKKLDVILPNNETSIKVETIEKAVHDWSSNFDLNLGGYVWSPKFPMPNNWQFYLQFYKHSKDKLYLQAVTETLNGMANGGIFDQIAGGFARYSTDVYWKAPHFEKMLYDNGQLMGLYAEAYQLTHNELYRDVVYKTHHFISYELTHATGLFYSALDADSEGVEGKYYIWTKTELQQLLGDKEPLFSLYYSVDAYGNWEHGANILYKTRSAEELEQLTGKDIAAIEATIQQCNIILVQERNKRVKPGLDDKIITSWNALMVSGYCQAYKAFNDVAFYNAAHKAIDGLLDELWVDKTLYRIYKNGKISIPAFAEDYACLCKAFIDFYQISFDEKYLHKANELMQLSIACFYDETQQLFYFKSNTDKALVARKLDLNDDVIPSANSTFAHCLQALAYYFDNTEYEKMLQQMLLLVQSKFAKSTSGYTNWMQVCLNQLQGVKQIVVAGADARDVIKQLQQPYRPHTLFAIATAESTIPLVQDKPLVADKTAIYVCTDKTCALPVFSADEVGVK